MGLLLDFSLTPKRRETTQGTVPAAVPEAGADIVIFPGVRFERATLDLGARVRQTPPDGKGKRRPDA